MISEFEWTSMCQKITRSVPVVGEIAPPLWVSSLDTFHQLLQLSSSGPASPGQVLLHLDTFHLQQLLLPQNLLLVRPFLAEYYQ